MAFYVGNVREFLNSQLYFQSIDKVLGKPSKKILKNVEISTLKKNSDWNCWGSNLKI